MGLYLEQYVHIQVVGKIHKILLDNVMVGGIGTASVAQEDYGMGIRILLPQLGFPYSFDVVADEFGCVMVGSDC